MITGLLLGFVAGWLVTSNVTVVANVGRKLFLRAKAFVEQ